MTDHETYVTKSKPTIDDWLNYNQDYFAALRGFSVNHLPQYAPLVDVDMHAAAVGLTIEEYYEFVRLRVGDLGHGILKLVHSDMDGAWHIVVADAKTEIN